MCRKCLGKTSPALLRAVLTNVVWLGPLGAVSPLLRPSCPNTCRMVYEITMPSDLDNSMRQCNFQNTCFQCTSSIFRRITGLQMEWTTADHNTHACSSPGSRHCWQRLPALAAHQPCCAAPTQWQQNPHLCVLDRIQAMSHDSSKVIWDRPNKSWF
mgnify:CR=1 FL=1